jgi:hypothetical protein
VSRNGLTAEWTVPTHRIDRGAEPPIFLEVNMTINKLWLMAVPLAVLGAACSKAPADDSLKNDLALASQAQSFTPQQVTSPTEQPLGTNPYTTPVRRVQTVSRAPAQTIRRTTSSSGRSSSAGRVVYEPAPAPAPVAVKHTKRDAAIGAGAGAVIGAVTSRDKVKGGLIGAAAGAILGGVIGNNVDITRKP